MPDLFTPPLTHNRPAYSVSEISNALKKVVENNFGQVRVRGEISGYKLATSGHAYLKLKDENALLDAVGWKGVIAKVPFKLEDGLEVICHGKLTTYPGRSNYQLVIDFIEPAGVGALMALLEKRKAMLATEGLFDPARKKALPYLPVRIGVVTSPTGAVIRDILHRIRERFPVHILVWGTLVQGEGAAARIAAAIAGFNALEPALKPDIIIVARGGGSLEDLWAFNEEVVVRAAANSRIPLISAVGHETDTTLIDFASDLRCPTPTAAAEKAVPVRQELLSLVLDREKRLLMAMTRFLQSHQDRLEGLSRGLANPLQRIEHATQRLDDIGYRLDNALPALLERKQQAVTLLAARLKPTSLMHTIENTEKTLQNLHERLQQAIKRKLQDEAKKITHLHSLLESLSPLKIMERGFVLVKDEKGTILTRANQISQNTLELVFFDGTKKVTV